MLSTFAAIAPSASPHARPGDPGTIASGPQLQNVTFPSVGGRSEQLDVYLPATPAPAGGYPVMIAIHGGAWRELDKGAFGLRTAQGFTPYGYAVVAPNYLLSAPGKPTWPVNLEDVRAAVRWVRSQTGTLDFNPDEIVAEGESAGANLAALLGVYSAREDGSGTSAAVDAVVAVSTPANLVKLYHQKRYAGGAASEFLGGPPRRVRANYIAASPIDQVSPDDPPMFLVHGRQDPIIPVSQSEEMQAALTAAGVPNEPALVHGGHGLDFPTHYSGLVPRIVAFLNAIWDGQLPRSTSTTT